MTDKREEEINEAIRDWLSETKILRKKALEDYSKREKEVYPKIIKNINRIMEIINKENINSPDYGNNVGAGITALSRFVCKNGESIDVSEDIRKAEMREIERLDRISNERLKKLGV